MNCSPIDQDLLNHFVIPQKRLQIFSFEFAVRESSHITSASEGGGGFQMLTDADRGRGGLWFADVSIHFC